MIMATNGNKEANEVYKPIKIDTIPTSKLTVVPKPELRPDKPRKEVQQDQVGDCDNLTASYWG